ncbi:hypothetical protein [Micromonospora carbonacea]|uniref:hypothetical protein n=1 Tax=Micromonospora carbonacea TaxID=47853 RepID=UPI00371CC582
MRVVADHAQKAATAPRRLSRLIADATEQAPGAEKVAFYPHILRSEVVLGGVI